MYAIIDDGGKQYKVEEGQLLDIEYRADAEAGSELTFDKVLAVGGDGDFKVGKPEVSGASVVATVVEQTQADKIYIQKFRRRKNSKRRTGHRQKYTTIKISKIA